MGEIYEESLRRKKKAFTLKIWLSAPICVLVKHVAPSPALSVSASQNMSPTKSRNATPGEAVAKLAPRAENENGGGGLG